MSLAIANEYGNVDITNGLPSKRYAHVSGKRLGLLCKKLRINYHPALIGFHEYLSNKYSPIIDGVVVSRASEKKLRDAISERERRAAKRKKDAIERLDVMSAIFTLNRRAKRCRDMAIESYERRQFRMAARMKNEKERIYESKEQVLAHLLREGRLEVIGNHRFGGGNWTELLRGENYCFHRPCPPPERNDGKQSELSSIESKPKESREPTLEVAREVVKKYLSDKEIVAVYSWPSRFEMQEDDDENDEVNDDEWMDEFDAQFAGTM